MINIANEFARKAQEVWPDSYVYLFGSQAMGTARHSSDIDLAVLLEKVDYGDDPAEVYDRNQANLYRLVEDMDPRIEPHLVDCSRCDGFFLRSILKTGIEIAKPKV